MGVSSPTGKKRRKQFAVGKNRDIRECTGAAFHGCAPNSLVADQASFPTPHGGLFTMPCQVRHERLTLGRIARAAIDDTR